MKKFVSIFVLLAVFAGAVFAAPAASLKESQSAPTLTEVDLFADVQADALTQEEAAAIEGEGFWGALIGGIVGGVCGALAGSSAGILGTVLVGIGGAVAGAYLGATTNTVTVFGSL